MLYVHAVARRWWVVVILVALGVAGALVSLASTPATFRAQSQLLVTPQPVAGGPVPSTDYIESRAQAYSIIASSAPFSAEVRSTVGENGTYPQYQVTVQNGTTVIVVSATDVSAARARRAAATVSDLIVSQSGDLDGSASRGVRLRTTVVSPSTADVLPASPNRVTVLGTGLAVGWVLGVALAYLLGRRAAESVAGVDVRRATFTRVERRSEGEELQS